MLDAAHRKADGPAVGIERLHAVGSETQMAPTGKIGSDRRGRPSVTDGVDTSDGARLTEAVARSRRS